MKGSYEDSRIRNMIHMEVHGSAILKAFESVIKEVEFSGKKGQYIIRQPDKPSSWDYDIVVVDSIPSLINFMAGALWFRNTFGFQKRKGEDSNE